LKNASRPERGTLKRSRMTRSPTDKGIAFSTDTLLATVSRPRLQTGKS
jgi:hypothetical protein